MKTHIGGRVGLVLFVALALALQACGSTPKQNSPGEASSEDANVPAPIHPVVAKDRDAAVSNSPVVTPAADSAGSGTGSRPNAGDLGRDADQAETKAATDGRGMQAGDGGNAGAVATLGGPSLCANSGFIVCDGFEEMSLSATRWSVKAGNGKTDSTHVARGKGALPLSSAGTRPLYQLLEYPAKLHAHHFGRMFMWSAEKYPTFGTQGFYAHVEVFMARSGLLFQSSLAVGIVGSIRMTQMPTDKAISPGPLMVAAKWYCVEWEMDPSKGAAQLWIDGKASQISGWSITGSTLPTVELGLVVYTSGATPVNLWVDEFALHDQRIGCAM